MSNFKIDSIFVDILNRIENYKSKTDDDDDFYKNFEFKKKLIKLSLFVNIERDLFCTKYITRIYAWLIERIRNYSYKKKIDVIQMINNRNDKFQIDL